MSRLYKNMIRFYILLVFFFISLLAVFKAPEYHLWLLAIAVTEFPLVFFGITLLLSLTGFWVGKYQLAGTILGAITMIIFLSPIVRAYWVAKDVRQDMFASLHEINGKRTAVAYPSDQRAIQFFQFVFETRQYSLPHLNLYKV